MSELRKLIVFIFVAVLFAYLIWINFNILNKFNRKKYLSYLMVMGLGLITLGTFIDFISELTHINFHTLIATCFTVGAILFVIYIILWSDYVAKTFSNLNEWAHTDPMTGIYNRKGFEKLFKKKNLKSKHFYIMVFDLDATKRINDNFGHLSGDKYIKNAAKIIKDEIGQKGFAGRFGGDEFIAFLENINEEEIEKVKLSIKKRVANIFQKQNTQISIGYSKHKTDGENFEELLMEADKRMYEDKKNRKDGKIMNIL